MKASQRPCLGGKRVRARCSSPHYDAVIVGNGPAACTFAIQLVRRGRTALLVPPRNEAAPNKPWGETLSPRGEFLLTRLGAADECLAGQYATQKVLSCWRNSDPEIIHLEFDPHGRMWHLSRRSFDNALLTHAAASGTEILDRTSHRITGFEKHPDGWKVRLSCSDIEYSVSAAFLVDATGRSSSIARRLGSKRVVRDQLAAIWCVREQAGDTAPLLIEPVRQGWWYSLGLSQGMLVVALVTDPTVVKVSASTRRLVWDSALDEAPHTKRRFGAEVNRLSVANIESAHLDRMGGEGWVAIGDAATSFDPLSAHGLCCALEQAMDVAELLCLSGHEAALPDFETRRIDLYEKYEADRIAFYKSVRRFSGYPFWRRRASHPLIAPTQLQLYHR